MKVKNLLKNLLKTNPKSTTINEAHELEIIVKKKKKKIPLYHSLNTKNIEIIQYVNYNTALDNTIQLETNSYIIFSFTSKVWNVYFEPLHQNSRHICPQISIINVCVWQHICNSRETVSLSGLVLEHKTERIGRALDMHKRNMCRTQARYGRSSAGCLGNLRVLKNPRWQSITKDWFSLFVVKYLKRQKLFNLLLFPVTCPGDNIFKEVSHKKTTVVDDRNAWFIFVR